MLPSHPLLLRTTQGQNSAEAAGNRAVLVSVGGASAVLLLLLGALGLLLWRRRGFRGATHGSRRSKLDVASVVALEELQDPELHSQLMSSLRRSRSRNRRDRPPSTASDPDPDGVFLMVYLPSPYEQTLTRIARAASTSSSKDLDLSPVPSPGPDSSSTCRLEVLQ